MRRVLCFITLLLATVVMQAQRGQDFASRFVQMCDGDTAVHCITVSPKMMEQLVKQADAAHNDHIADAIEKLKSARIVTANTHGESYYQKAENLLKRNKQRFSRNRSYRSDSAYGTFYIRKTREGQTVELIMLHADTKAQRMVIVNLTGDIDEDFINSLQKTFGDHSAKTRANQQGDISKLSQ